MTETAEIANETTSTSTEPTNWHLLLGMLLKALLSMVGIIVQTEAPVMNHTTSVFAILPVASGCAKRP